MNQRRLRLWAGLFLATGIIALIAWQGELFSLVGGDAPSLSVPRSTCGNLNDIWHYTTHPVPDGNNSPWAGFGDAPIYDSKLRQGCLFSESVAQTVLISSGVIGAALIISAPFVVTRRRDKTVPNPAP